MIATVFEMECLSAWGCLSVSHVHRDRLDIRVMKEKDCWFQLLSLPLDCIARMLGDDAISGYTSPSSFPLSEGANGEILITCGSFFVSCHPKQGILWVKKIKCL